VIPVSDPSASQRPVILPEGRTVWTDEFNPAGEYLPESVIQIRRARRAYQQPPPPPTPPLGLDLRQTGTPPLDSQRTNPEADRSYLGNENMLHHAALIQALRGVA
jgi:hypothetical protein